jgi:Fe-S cluster assembly iron-binding protein IscA
MLDLSQNATTVIGQIVQSSGMADGAGLRIASTQGQPDLNIEPVDSPEAGDQVVESDGARVFLEADAAVVLDDKVLDAQVDDQGRIQFFLGEQ